MKNLRFGFSIAEVTTALAIVGIVAALVIPMIVKNVQKQQTGPILAKAVQQIELGCMNMVQHANSIATDGSYWDSLGNMTFKDVLGESGTTQKIFLADDEFAKIFAPYINAVVVGVDWNDVPKIKNFDGTNVPVLLVNTMIEKGEAYKFNNIQAEFSITNFLESPTFKKWVFIDVNGWKSPPNTFGKDIFEFDWPVNSCKLTPYASDVTNGLQYTKQIVKDGFRVKYY